MSADERPEPAPAAGPRGSLRNLAAQRRVRLGALVVVAAAAVVLGWAVSRGDDAAAPAAEPQRTAEPIPPVALGEDGLRTRAAELGQPVYWVGAEPGHTYELTRTAEGNVYVRYLPAGAAVGAEGSSFLVVATYPFAGALEALRQVGEGRELELEGGAVALVDERNASSVYLAYPDVDYQVEVYDPSPERALELARSGAVRPVG